MNEVALERLIWKEIGKEGGKCSLSARQLRARIRGRAGLSIGVGVGSYPQT